jgi:large subunit ribosomal protein L30
LGQGSTILLFPVRISQILSKMAKIKVTQVKSGIDRPERQKRTLKALGLRKLNSSVEVEATDQIKGMVTKVLHLVKVEDVK